MHGGEQPSSDVSRVAHLGMASRLRVDDGPCTGSGGSLNCGLNGCFVAVVVMVGPGAFEFLRAHRRGVSGTYGGYAHGNILCDILQWYRDRKSNLRSTYFSKRIIAVFLDG